MTKFVKAPYSHRTKEVQEFPKPKKLTKKKPVKTSKNDH